MEKDIRCVRSAEKGTPDMPDGKETPLK